MNNAKKLSPLQAIRNSRIIRSVGRFIPFILTLLVGLAILAVVIQRIGPSSLGSVFLSFIGWGAIPVIGLTILSVCVNLLRWKLILKHRGYNLPYRKLIGPWLVGNTFSYITPITYVGGELISCQMLKENSDVDWAKGFASIAIDKILEGTIMIVSILAGLYFFLFEIGIPSFGIGLLLSVSAIIGFAFLLFFFYSRSFRRKSIAGPFITRPLRLDHSKGGEVLKTIEANVFEFFQPREKMLWLGLLLTIAKAVIIWLRSVFLIFFLGGDIVLGKAMSAQAFSYLSGFIPIPGSLGTQEAIQTYSFSSLEMGADTGVVFTLIIRAIELIIVAAGAVIFLHWGTRFMVARFIRAKNDIK